MSRRRRAAALGALALALAILAASDVAGQQSRLRRKLGPPVAVLVARRSLPAGRVLAAGDLAVRAIPARFAPPDAYARTEAVTGLRAAVPLRAGSFLVPGTVRAPAPARSAPSLAPRKGQRVIDVVARAAPGQISAGVRVDVLVARTDRSAPATLALRDVAVTATRAAPADQEAGAAGGPRVEASLLVTVRQALALAAAQGSSREITLLPRPAGEP
jgi:pilus assembly protein CpaB